MAFRKGSLTGLMDGLIKELEADILHASIDVAARYEEQVRAQPQVPVDTGALRGGSGYNPGRTVGEGLRIVSQKYSRGHFKAAFASTTKTKKSGFDYPMYLDTKGRHQGWWETVNSDRILTEAVGYVFPRYGL